MGERDADPDAPRGAPPSAALVGRRATMAATGVLLSLFSLGSCFANYVPFPHQQLLGPVITFGSAAGAVFAFLGAIFDRPRPGP